MSNKDDDRFRVRPGTSKQRGDAFINKVLRQTNKAGAKLGKMVGKVGHRPGSRLGAWPRRGPLRRGPAHAQCPARDDQGTAGQFGQGRTAFNYRTPALHRTRWRGSPGWSRPRLRPNNRCDETTAFEERGREDRHQFRFIVSPEDAEQLDDLRTYTRHLMARMEADLGTRLEWVAVDHWNTNNPHTHVVLRGKDDTGKDLIISRDYIAEGIRHRAAELATEWLGPYTELEIQRAMQREVDQERWTGLDRTLQREAVDGLVRLETLAEPRLQRRRQMLIGRLQHLQRMGLATK